MRTELWGQSEGFRKKNCKAKESSLFLLPTVTSVSLPPAICHSISPFEATMNILHQTLVRLCFIVLLLGCLNSSCANRNANGSVDPNSTIVYSNSPFDLQGINAKFAKDISYDSKERTQFDIWLPTSTAPIGLVIYVHGGGFTSGDKNYVYSVQQGGAWDFPYDIRFLLQNNIAFATIRYSLLSQTGEREGIKNLCRM